MKQMNIGYKIFVIFNAVVMIGVLLVTTLPYLHVLAKALNESNDTMMGGITFYPRKLDFTNFIVLLKDASMKNAFLISVSRVGIATFLSLFVQFSGAFVLTRKFPGRGKIMIFMIIPMFFTGGIIPTYLIFVKLKLINNYLVYILPSLCSYYNVLIMKSYMESAIPNSLSEAAFLDGASEFTTLCRIIIPLSKPVIATVALWVAVAHWNDWISTLYFITNERLFTLQYKLMQLIKESERLQNLIREAAMAGNMKNIATEVKTTPESLISAQVIITTIPIIIVYPFLQKYFVQGIMLGAVKQ